MSELQRVGEHIRTRVKLPSVDPMVLEARRVWSTAVGEDVARNALPVRRAGDALVVHCSSSTWAAELAMLLSARYWMVLLLNLRRPPARLRFEVGTVLQEPARAEPAKPLPPLTDEHRRQARELVAGIDDEVLAARMREAVELSLRRGL